MSMFNERLTNIWPTPRLIRAARGFVGIDQGELAELAGVSRKAVVAIESDDSESMDYRRVEVLQKLRSVFEERFDVEFVRATANAGEGLRLKKRRNAGARS
jgi:DNA-binding XRE family transcriptional regulator